MEKVKGSKKLRRPKSLYPRGDDKGKDDQETTLEVPEQSQLSHENTHEPITEQNVASDVPQETREIEFPDSPKDDGKAVDPPSPTGSLAKSAPDDVWNIRTDDDDSKQGEWEDPVVNPYEGDYQDDSPRADRYDRRLDDLQDRLRQHPRLVQHLVDPRNRVLGVYWDDPRAGVSGLSDYLDRRLDLLEEALHSSKRHPVAVSGETESDNSMRVQYIDRVVHCVGFILKWARRLEKEQADAQRWGITLGQDWDTNLIFQAFKRKSEPNRWELEAREKQKEREQRFLNFRLRNDVITELIAQGWTRPGQQSTTPTPNITQAPIQTQDTRSASSGDESDGNSSSYPITPAGTREVDVGRNLTLRTPITSVARGDTSAVRMAMSGDPRGDTLSPAQIAIFQHNQAPPRLTLFTRAELVTFQQAWTTSGATAGWLLENFVDEKVRFAFKEELKQLRTLEPHLQRLYPNLLEEIKVRDFNPLRDWEWKKFFDVAFTLVAGDAAQSTEPREVQLVNRIRKLTFQVDYGNGAKNPMYAYQMAVMTALTEIGYLTTISHEDEPDLIPTHVRKDILKIIYDSIPKGSPSSHKEFILDRIYASLKATHPLTGPIPTICEALTTISTLSREPNYYAAAEVLRARSHASAPAHTPRRHEERKREPDSRVTTSTASSVTSGVKRGKPEKAPCNGCGRTHEGGCLLENHPDFNRSSAPWAASTIGQWWANAPGGRKYDRLPANLRRSEDGTKVIPWDNQIHLPKSQDKKRKPSGKCNTCPNSSVCIAQRYSQLMNPNLIRGSVDAQHETLEIAALLDTGADSGNFVNEDTASWLRLHGAKSKRKPRLICSCFGDCRMFDECLTNVCVTSLDSVTKQRKMFT